MDSQDTQLKVIDLLARFVKLNLEEFTSFKAALIVGSHAYNEARDNSDVDCIFLFDKVDYRLVPAEFVWSLKDNAIYSTEEKEAEEVDGIQIDAKRLGLDEFLTSEWSDPLKHDISHAVYIFDRDGNIEKKLDEKINYPDTTRIQRIEDHFGRASYQLGPKRINRWIKRGGLLSAHDQISIAFEEIIQLLHAYNKVWLPWQYRWLISTSKLSWLPENYSKLAESIMGNIQLNEANFSDRLKFATELLKEIEEKLNQEGLLKDAGELFDKIHPELGYSHNMDDWKRQHASLMKDLKK